MTTLGQSVVISAKWSSLLEIVTRGVNTLTIAILARLLGPADFGLLAGSLLFASLAQVFCEAGLGKALVQARELPERAPSTVFWTILLLSGVTYGAACVAAPRLGALFGCAECVPALRLLGVQIVIFALTAVHEALLIRHLEFGQLFRMKALGSLVASGVSLALAWYGLGGWALVAGALTGQVANAAFVWVASPWRPTLVYDAALALRMWRFGVWTQLESLVSWLWVWGPGFIIATVLGISELGAYRVGMSVVGAIFASVTQGFRPVLYSGLARLQHDAGEQWRVFRRANRVIAAVILPVGAFLVFAGDVVTTAVLGSPWSGVSVVLVIGGAWYSAIWLVRFNQELFRAIGRADINVWLAGALAVWVVAAAAVTAPYGLVVLLLASASSAVVEIGVQLYLVHRVLRVSPWYLWHDTRASGVAAFLMGLLLLGMRTVLAHESSSVGALLESLALLTAGSAAYAMGLWLVDRRFFVESVRLVWRAARAA